MVVTVARDPYLFNPADRIEAVDIVIRPDNAVIQSWDTATTLYSTISAGALQLTGTNSATGGASLGTPATAPTVASLTGSATASQARQESLTATEQVESLTVFLNNIDSYRLDPGRKNELHIHRQGGIGVDLTGNIILKVDIAIPDHWNHVYMPASQPLIASRRTIFSVKGNYFDDKGKRAAPESLKLLAQTNRIAEYKDDSQAPPAVTGTATLVYTLRHIVSGDDTLEEKDDTIYERTVQANDVQIVLVPGAEVVPRAYSVVEANSTNVPLMAMSAGSGRPTKMCFATQDEASTFIAYLQHATSKPESFAGATLVFTTARADHPLRPLAMADLPGLVTYGHCYDEGSAAVG